MSGAGSGGEYSLRTICFDSETGKLVWSTDVFSAVAGRMHNKNSPASPTPIVEGDRLYVHFGHMGTACLDLSGKVLWRNQELNYSPVHGNGGTPVVAGDALVFSCDGASDPFVVALSKTTGKLLWKVPRQTTAKKTFSFSTPLTIDAGGKPQVLSPGSGVLSAFNPENGDEVWRVLYGEGYSVIPRPVSGNGLIYISSGFDRPTILAIKPGGKGDVTATHVAWTASKGAPNTPSLLLVGNELYSVSDGGIASCFDAKTGAVHWQERVAGGYSASPVYADGRIYLQNETGVGTVLQAGKTFQPLSTNTLGERTLASYAVTDGAIFIRGEEHLFRIQEPKRQQVRSSSRK